MSSCWSPKSFWVPVLEPFADFKMDEMLEHASAMASSTLINPGSAEGTRCAIDIGVIQFLLFLFFITAALCRQRGNAPRLLYAFDIR